MNDHLRHSGRPLIVLGLVVFATLCAVMIAVLARTGALDELARGLRPLPVHGTVADFTLTERSGRTVTRADLAGRVWVADFIFTRCQTICPRMTTAMAALAGELADTPEVRFVSITVDPTYDTIFVLADFAARYDADPDRWLFLTGDKDAIYPLLADSFHLSAEGADGAFNHSTRFVLVDGTGRIRGYYDSTETAAMERLGTDARRLRRELPRS
jgi:protein SCO1/2